MSDDNNYIKFDAKKGEELFAGSSPAIEAVVAEFRENASAYQMPWFLSDEGKNPPVEDWLRARLASFEARVRRDKAEEVWLKAQLLITLWEQDASKMPYWRDAIKTAAASDGVDLTGAKENK